MNSIVSLSLVRRANRRQWLALGTALFALVGADAFAQPTNVGPGAIQKELAPKPAPKTTGGMSIPAPMMQAAPEGASKTHLTLQTLDIEGSTVFSQAKLQEFAAGMVGKDVTLADVFAVAQKITKAYSNAGYILSLAYVPAQQIKDGHVKIQVVEGYVAEVEIAGNPGKAKKLLEKYGAKIKAAHPLTKRAFERYLLLANDIPGMSVRGFLDRGPSGLGAVKLILSASHKKVASSVGVNNRGSKALGPNRVVLSAAEYGNAAGTESAQIAAVQSFQRNELKYVYGRLDTIVGDEGDVLGLSGTFTRSKPGIPVLKALGFATKGWSVTGDFSHPAVRSRSFNLDVKGQFDVIDLRSDFGAIHQSHDQLRVARLGAGTDFFNTFGGTTRGDFLLSQGVGALGATKDNDPLKSRPNGSAEFTTVSAELVHTHALSQSIVATVSASAQAASRALLASEECGYGGAVYGRGFDSYEISGENCINGSAELSYLLPVVRRSLSATPYVFFDAGLVRQKGSLLSGEKRQESGTSVGAGVRFQLAGHISGSVEVAQPLTRDVALEGNRKARVFFSISLVP